MSILNQQPLDGATVAILGGAGRMGVATASEVIGMGARVILIGRTQSSLDAEASSLGPAAKTIRLDADVPGALADKIGEAGNVDHIVVAVSAGAAASSIPGTKPEVVQRAFARFWTSYNAVHLAPQFLPRNGSVTLLSGSSSRTPASGYGVWTTLHGAIEALVRAAAIDIAPIRVNAVSPGGIDINPDRQLVERPGQPSDIGVAVASLIVNPAVTGAILDVDSGERKGTWSGNSIVHQ